jgi:hypothetical protein
MMTIAQARDALNTALATVPSMNVLTKPGQQPTVFPAIYVAPPLLGFTNFSQSAPTDAEFQLYLILAANDYAIEKMDDVINDVVAAIWEIPNAVITKGIPGIYPSGSVDLPAYLLTCEVSL